MERLSSGYRINSAKDDAAGLAISNRMTSQIRGMNQAIRNANDAISLAQTAEGALHEDVEIIQRMRELALQSSNGTYTPDDRQAMDEEFQQLKQEYYRIAEHTEFNGQKLLDGSFSQKTFQVGPNAGASVSISLPPLGPPASSSATSTTTPGSIDVVFLLDTTGSMGTAVSELRTDISNVINDLQEITSDLSVGVIAYSDVYPGNTETFVLTEMDTAGETQLNNFLTALTEGGGTEYLGQAIQEAAALDWDEEANQLILVLGSAGDEADDEAVALQAAEDFNNSSEHRTVSAISANGDSTFFQNLSTVGGGEYSTYTPGNLIDVIGDISDEVITIPESEQEDEPATFDSATIETFDDAQDALSVLDETLLNVDSVRADLGAFMNRMEHTIANLQNISENLSAARSRILDADIAIETSVLTKQNILQQVGVSILSQANQQPQIALSLMGQLG